MTGARSIKVGDFVEVCSQRNSYFIRVARGAVVSFTSQVNPVGVTVQSAMIHLDERKGEREFTRRLARNQPDRFIDGAERWRLRDDRPVWGYCRLKLTEKGEACALSSATSSTRSGARRASGPYRSEPSRP